MELSVIIVNYNVRHFLEQCLFSVHSALKGINGEVIVVDNNSTDNSLEYLQPRFPEMMFVANPQNQGFGKACNQGFELASGNFILFLNPDTIVAENCFSECLSFFASRPEAGAIGVKMIDGSGKFLKESKRAFPSPLTSFYKLSGLATLFPRSKIFSKYHLGHLDENETHEVDVLAGAFMLIRKEVLDKTGLFDEAFFMYGEDIDLSYRIQKAGFRNYYFAGTTIIHFKGESTKKTSVNYVRMFYQAMSIFVRKHYGGSKAGIFNILIQSAIWVKAIFSAAGKFMKSIGLPLFDAGMILLSFWLVKTGWNEYIRTDIPYHDKLLWISFPIYGVFFLVVAWYAGLYDKWYRLSGLIRTSAIATIILLAAYGLLPEQYRLSRAIIVFGALLSFVFIALLRLVLIRTGVLANVNPEKKATVICGSSKNYNEVMTILKEAGQPEKILGRLSINDGTEPGIGSIIELNKPQRELSFTGIIFSQGDLTFNQIISCISTLPKGVSARIHAEGSQSIVGSDSKDETGLSLSAGDSFRLADPHNKRLKRLIDIITSLLAIVLFPFHLFFIKRPFPFFVHALEVMSGNKTWIGYAKPARNLPSLRIGVIGPNGLLISKQQLPADSLQMMDYWYARDYRPASDVRLLWTMYRHLGG